MQRQLVSHTSYRDSMHNVLSRKPRRLSVNRHVVNACFDKIIERKVKARQRVGKCCQVDCDIHEGDPVFTLMGIYSNVVDMIVFANYHVLLEPTLCSLEADVANKSAATQIFEMCKVRFVGFSETVVSCGDGSAAHRESTLTLNAGGSLSVQCGEMDGLREGDDICLELPSVFNTEHDLQKALEKDMKTPCGALSPGRLRVRSVRKVEDEITNSDFEPRRMVKKWGTCLDGGNFGENVYVRLTGSHPRGLYTLC